MDDARAGPRTPMQASVAAGALSGIVGAVSFWAFHTRYIADVPAVLLEGTLWGLGAGAAVGWAYQHLHERSQFPADARGGLLLAATLWLLLVPYEVVGLAFGPFTHMERPAELLAIAPVGLLGVPIAAALGWAMMRHRRGAIALAIATGVLHFMIGGSIVYFGGRGTILLLFAWMLPTFLMAGLLLIALRARLLRKARASASSTEVNT